MEPICGHVCKSPVRYPCLAWVISTPVHEVIRRTPGPPLRAVQAAASAVRLPARPHQHFRNGRNEMLIDNFHSDLNRLQTAVSEGAAATVVASDLPKGLGFL